MNGKKIIKKEWLKKNRLPLSVFLVAAITVLLSSCSSGVVTKIRVIPPAATPAKASLAQQRSYFVSRLRQQGVQIIRLGETMKVVLPSDQLFNTNSANIVSAYQPVLNDVAGLLQTLDKVKIKVASYTDNSHAGKRGRVLTTRQAQVVASYLWSHGVNARMVYAAGYGATHPVAWNGTSRGREANRRVEITFRYYPVYRNYD